MQQSYKNKISFFLSFSLLAIFFLIDTFALSFFQQPVTLFLVGSYSSIILAPHSIFPALFSLFLLALHIALFNISPYLFIAFILSSFCITFLLKKSIYTTHSIRFLLSAFIIILYSCIVERLPFYTMRYFILLLVQLATGVIASRIIIKSNYGILEKS